MLKWKTGLLCGYPVLKWLLESMVLNALHSLRCSSSKGEPSWALPGELGWCWLCCAGMGEAASSSNASGSKAPPGTGTTSSQQHRAGVDPTVPALSGSDPAPLGALSEQPVLFAGYHIHLAWNCSLPPPFYQPSVASSLLWFIHRCHCRSFVQNIPFNLSVCVLLLCFFLDKLLFNFI